MKACYMKKLNSTNMSQHLSVRALFPRVKTAEAWSAAHSFWGQVAVRIRRDLYPPLVAQFACTIDFNLLQIIHVIKQFDSIGNVSDCCSVDISNIGPETNTPTVRHFIGPSK
jgi:hypothetical protein